MAYKSFSLYIVFRWLSRGKGQKFSKNLETTSTFWPHMAYKSFSLYIVFRWLSRAKGQKFSKNLETTSTFWPHMGEIKQIHIENPRQTPRDKNLVTQANRRLGLVHPWKTWFPLETLHSFERDDHKWCDGKDTKKDGSGLFRDNVSTFSWRKHGNWHNNPHPVLQMRNRQGITLLLVQQYWMV